MKRELILLLLACTMKVCVGQSLIPRPVSMQTRDGHFVFGETVRLRSGSSTKGVTDVAHYIQSCLRELGGVECSGKKKFSKQGTIELSIIDSARLGDEGYLLSVNPSGIRIEANGSRGLFYGVQSLLQLLPAIRTNQQLAIPCVDIVDYPRFKWRGLMLDVSRHFFGPDLIKEFIDLLAAYKMNVFHWHLVDGAGWRLEIKKYPKLTSLAAWRVDDWGKPWDWSSVRFNADRSKATYGGYYTQEQVKEIVAYAEARNITIVPEIEMPGHSEAALAAYPEFSCRPKSNFGMTGDFYAHDVQSNYCAGNDSAFTFIEDVLDEVMALFPSTYIHIGGDEVDKTSWKTCPKCQARMKAEGLKNEEELQSYFVKRIERYLNSKGRKLIGWDEILEGGLAPEATVMSWRGEGGGIKAASMHHDVVMTPGTPCYFDHYQGDPESEPKAIGGFNTLMKVYMYEPIPSALSGADTLHVLGAQGNLWTEYVPTYEHAEYMILPRMPALAEVLWSPTGLRNWKDFSARLQSHLVGFEQRGLHYSKGNFKIDIKPLLQDGQLRVALSTENPEGQIYYTTDGAAPTMGSLKYTEPFTVNSSITVKASLALNNSIVPVKCAEQAFSLNKATGKTIRYETPNSRYYPAGGSNTLVDGIRGTTDIGKQWHAFNGNDLVATIDLGQPVEISTITLGCLQNYGQWIFFPRWVKFEVSEDGSRFEEVETVQNGVPVDDKAAQIKDFTARFATRKVKAIRVTARNTVCPAGHPGENKPGWLFCDEIIVN